MVLPAEWFSAGSISQQLATYASSVSRVPLEPGSGGHDFMEVVRCHLHPLFTMINNPGADWLSLNTLETVSTGLAAMQHVVDQLQSLHAIERHARVSVMLCHTLTWAWLESICAHYSQSRFWYSTSSAVDGWAPKLARNVYTWLTSRLEAVSVRPSDYIPSLSNELETLALFGRNEIFVTQPHIQQRVYTQMKIILQKWLHFPTTKLEDGQAWTIDILIAAFGFGVLFLDETWNIFSTFAPRVLGRRSREVRNVHMHQLLPFAYRLQFCDAGISGSIARHALDQFEVFSSTLSSNTGVLLEMHRALQSYTPSVDESSDESPSLPSFPLSLDPVPLPSDLSTSFDRVIQRGRGVYRRDVGPDFMEFDEDPFLPPSRPDFVVTDYSQVIYSYNAILATWHRLTRVSNFIAIHISAYHTPSESTTNC